jgi:hypothetical protein
MIKIFFLRLLVFGLSFFTLLKLPGFFDIYATNDQPRDLHSIGCSRNYEAIELLFLGSSYTYSSLNPQYFDSIGLKSYNLGISGAGVFFTELVLDDYYNAVKIKPKYLIIDISHFAFCDKSDDFLTYPLHRYLNKALTHEALLWKYPGYSPLYLELLAKSSKKGLSCVVSTKMNLNNSNCINRGFYTDDTEIDRKIEKEDSLKFKFLKDAKFDKKKFYSLSCIVKKYRDKGIKVFWFEAPTQQLKYFFNEQYRKDYEKALTALRKNENMKEFDLNDLMLEREDFRNTDHLNTKGAKKISIAISNHLRSYLNPDN